MTAEKCKELVLNAVALATIRDGSSGGVIRLAVIDKTGTKRTVSYLILEVLLKMYQENVIFQFLHSMYFHLINVL